jgi:thiamine biosynthesis protein ThiS
VDEVNGTNAITLQVNGKPRSLEVGSSVLDLLGSLDLHERLVVVEHNGTILKRAAFAETMLADGDVIEIAHFVGGG